MADPGEHPSHDREPSTPVEITPDVVRSFRSQLTLGGDEIDPSTWAGSMPQAQGIAPRVRIGKNRWFNLLWLLPIGSLTLLLAVAAAKGLRNMAPVERFITRYPGTTETARAKANPGFPFWVGLQHFFNMFLMIFIIRAGLQILADHPRLYWTRHSTPGKDWFRIQKPVPSDPLWTAKQDSIGLPPNVGLPGLRHTIGLARWWHLGSDSLWLLNGIVFYALLFATGQWRHLVPTTWTVFPNALSTLIQYLSLNWPAEHGWVAYNGLQLLAYFITVFVAAPLALITGLGMSPALSTRFKRISRVLSIQTARSVHFLVLAWFLMFIVMHVTMVFATGMLNNLNHIYADRNDASWIGFAVFAASMALCIVAWVAATPFTLRHPRGATGRVRVDRSGTAPLRTCGFDTGRIHRKGSLAVLLAQRAVPRFRRVQGTVRPQLRRLSATRQRPRRQSRRPQPRRVTRPPIPRADHAALLHPGVVGSRQVGRCVDANDHGSGEAGARGEVGCLLLTR